MFLLVIIVLYVRVAPKMILSASDSSPALKIVSVSTLCKFCYANKIQSSDNLLKSLNQMPVSSSSSMASISLYLKHERCDDGKGILKTKQEHKEEMAGE